MDSDTALKIVGGYLVTKEIVGKILGPTADYLGTELKDWAERRLTNISRIFKNAEDKLGDRVNEPGSVHPKVLKEVLDDGSFAEDDLAVEYFGGVLASSRTGVSRDDRGAALAKLVAGLTSYQLRSHFYFYRLFKELFDGEPLSLTEAQDRAKIEIFVPSAEYYAALEMTPGENFDQIISHSMFGLSRQGLIETFVYGRVERVKEFYSSADTSGLLLIPSVLGLELFLWAHGLGHVHPARFLDSDVRLESAVQIPIHEGVRRTKEPPPEPAPGADSGAGA